MCVYYEHWDKRKRNAICICYNDPFLERTNYSSASYANSNNDVEKRDPNFAARSGRAERLVARPQWAAVEENDEDEQLRLASGE